MEETITDEEICKQLLELAQTQEQVRYLTSNNQAVLLNKINDYKLELQSSIQQAKELRHINEGKEKAYLKAIMSLAYERWSNDY